MSSVSSRDKRLSMTKRVSQSLVDVKEEAKDVYRAVRPSLTMRRSSVDVDVLGMPAGPPLTPIPDDNLSLSPPPPAAPPLPGQESQEMLGWGTAEVVRPHAVHTQCTRSAHAVHTHCTSRGACAMLIMPMPLQVSEASKAGLGVTSDVLQQGEIDWAAETLLLTHEPMRRGMATMNSSPSLNPQPQLSLQPQNQPQP